MILDHISGLVQYGALEKEIFIILEYIKQNDLNTMPVGRYDIEGSNSFVLIQQYQTKMPSEVKWESHKKYIDIQLVLFGSEQMGYMSADQMRVNESYSLERDILFYEEIDSYISFEVKENYFAVFLPTDVHKPGCLVKEIKEVKKAVIKLHIS